jgi:hypothetical protein
MTTILYNTATATILHTTHGGYYTVDGQRPALPENIIELEQVQDEVPQYNAATHKLLSAWVVDTDLLEYRLMYWAEAKTAYEMAMDGWHHPGYAKRIIAPVQLVMDDLGIKFHAWFNIRQYPIERVGEQLYCYCHTIAPEHQYAVDAFQGVITIEDQPS